jgi:hypothetical protein
VCRLCEAELLLLRDHLGKQHGHGGVRGSPWQDMVGASHCWSSISCKQPLRFPKSQSPETLGEEDRLENPAVACGKRRSGLTPAWPCL